MATKYAFDPLRTPLSRRCCGTMGEERSLSKLLAKSHVSFGKIKDALIPEFEGKRDGDGHKNEAGEDGDDDPPMRDGGKQTISVGYNFVSVVTVCGFMNVRRVKPIGEVGPLKLMEIFARDEVTGVEEGGEVESLLGRGGEGWK